MNIISQLATAIKTEMEASPLFPFSDRSKQPASKQFKPHMLNVASKNNPIIMISPTMEYFEIGNEEAEVKAPQYHILEDAKTIRNPYQGTKQSLGTQRKVKDKAKRDYGKTVFLKNDNNITFGQEYRQSFTERSNIWKENLRLSTRRFEQNLRKRRGKKYEKSFRYNEHYGYIERILTAILPNIAVDFDAKLITGRMTTEDPELLLVENGEQSLNMSDVIQDTEYEDLFNLTIGEEE